MQELCRSRRRRSFHRLSWDIHHGLWPFEPFKEILISKTPAKATASQYGTVGVRNVLNVLTEYVPIGDAYG
jgi:hypothetical protein